MAGLLSTGAPTTGLLATASGGFAGRPAPAPPAVSLPATPTAHGPVTAPKPVSPAPSATGPVPRITPTTAAGTGSGPGPGGSGQPVPALNSLYAQNPGATTFNPSNTGTATPTGAAPIGNAANVGPLAAINQGQIDPNDATNAASQVDAITNANSPYIQQATQQGFLSAASRGLANSSLSAGASEAAAVQAAAPLALQNAQAATGGKMQNSQLDTQANEFNASQENANQQLNAQMETQQTQFNASQKQQADATNAAAQNAMTQQTQQLNEQINQQYLSGTQSQSLAAIQGRFNELIQQNASASGMYTSMLNNIGATMANKDISPQRVADTISAMQSLLSGGLSVVDAINGGSPSTVPLGTARPSTPPTAPGAKPAAPTNIAPQPIAPSGPFTRGYYI